MSTDFTEQGSRKKFARLVGGTYLLYIVTMVLADVFGNIGRSSVPELAAATSAGDLSFRVGLVFALVSALLFVLIAWGLYTLLRPVNKDLALLFLLLNAVGVAIQCVSMLPLISTMLQTDAVSQMQAFSPAQLSALPKRASACSPAALQTGKPLKPLGAPRKTHTMPASASPWS